MIAFDTSHDKSPVIRLRLNNYRTVTTQLTTALQYPSALANQSKYTIFLHRLFVSSNVLADNNAMVSLIRLQSKLLKRLDSLLSQLLDLTGKNSLGLNSRVDTVGLDGDDDSTLVLEEEMCVEGNDSGLIGLGNIGKNGVDHANEHSVLLGVSGILNDGDDVGSLLGHAYQVSARSVRKLDGVHSTGGAHDISNVRNRGTGGSTQVQDLGSGLDEQLVKTTEDTGSQLGSEGVPHSVLDLGGLSLGGGGGHVNRHSLLAVNALAGGQVLGDQEILLSSGNENTAVSMGLDNDLGTTSSTASGTTSGTASSASVAKATTATSSTTVAKATSASASSASVTAESSSSSTSSAAKATSATSATSVSAAESASAAASSTSRSKAHDYVFVCVVFWGSAKLLAQMGVNGR